MGKLVFRAILTLIVLTIFVPLIAAVPVSNIAFVISPAGVAGLLVIVWSYPFLKKDEK